jgi:TldD protein
VPTKEETLDRRDFLKTVVIGGSAALVGCGGARPPTGEKPEPGGPAFSDPARPELADVALDAATAAGASYADIRIADYRRQLIRTREKRVEQIVDGENSGFGVRVIAAGAWGFASSPNLEREEIARVARQAVAVAKASAAIREQPVQLAPVSTHRDAWATPIRVDPFDVALEDKVDRLLSINSLVLGRKGVSFCNSFVDQVREHKFFASTEGSYIEQTMYRIHPSFTATSVDPKQAGFQTRRALVGPAGRGFEHFEEYPWEEEARRAAEDVVAKQSAPSVEPGKRDLILHPTHLWLTIHETIGHPSELDRALGMEANFAGTSFLTPDKLGEFRFGSDIVNMVADLNLEHGLATSPYDDDGVPTAKWHMVKDGMFVDYHHTRETAPWLDKERSYGCSYSQSWKDEAILRMANLSLAPGREPLSLEQLIAGTDDGILIQGEGSWSIDHQRYNFQFGGQLFHEIKGGKIARLINDVAYQSNTPEFWRSCDAICSEDELWLGGSFYCGKGEPVQARPVSHNSAPARFRQVNVLNTKRSV